jgi:hypothetical protein
MPDPKVTRLGQTRAGVVQSSAAIWEFDDPVPLVLWATSGQPDAALLYAFERNETEQTYTQTISHLAARGGDTFDASGAQPGGFPITYRTRAKTNQELDLLDDIEPASLVTADVNGDGIDELVFARRRGGGFAYSATQRLFQHQPHNFPPEMYALDFLRPLRVRLSGRDTVFLVINRSLHGTASDLTPEQTAFDSGTENYAILRVDTSGIGLVRLGDLGYRIGRVAVLGALSRSDSGGLDELLVWSSPDDDASSLYLSRHRPDGSLMAAPRKIYVDVPSDRGLVSAFVPNLAELVIVDPAGDRLYFVTPDKPANWIRTLELKKQLSDSATISFLTVMRSGAAALAVLRQENHLYVLDADGRFYEARSGSLTPHSDRVPWAVLDPESGSHTLTGVFAPEGGDGRLLAVWSRPPGARPLAEAELTAAGKKFLYPDEYASAEEARTITFDGAVVSKAESLAAEQGVGHKLSSLQDVQDHLPEFYETLRTSAHSLYLKLLEDKLLSPLTREGFRLQEGDYQHMGEYRTWLQGVYRGAELLFTLIGSAGNISGKIRIPDVCQPEIDTNLYLPRVACRGRGDRGVAVLALRRRTLTEEEAPGYYQIEW